MKVLILARYFPPDMDGGNTEASVDRVHRE